MFQNGVKFLSFDLDLRSSFTERENWFYSQTNNS